MKLIQMDLKLLVQKKKNNKNKEKKLKKKFNTLKK